MRRALRGMGRAKGDGAGRRCTQQAAMLQPGCRVERLHAQSARLYERGTASCSGCSGASCKLHLCGGSPPESSSKTQARLRVRI